MDSSTVEILKRMDSSTEEIVSAVLYVGFCLQSETIRLQSASRFIEGYKSFRAEFARGNNPLFPEHRS